MTFFRIRVSLIGHLKASGAPSLESVIDFDYSGLKQVWLFKVPEVTFLPSHAVENRQQVTAIVTGIISVVLAFGYLSLISLDSRGVNLIPPPPEALGE